MGFDIPVDEDISIEYSTKEIDGCTVSYSKAFSISFSTYIIQISANNPCNEIKIINFYLFPIKINGWYHKIPWVVRIDPNTTANWTIYKEGLIKADNLTQIEELAKERNLV